MAQVIEIPPLKWYDPVDQQSQYLCCWDNARSQGISNKDIDLIISKHSSFNTTLVKFSEKYYSIIFPSTYIFPSQPKNLSLWNQQLEIRSRIRKDFHPRQQLILFIHKSPEKKNWLCFYQTRSAWSMDQGSTKKRSAVHNFVPTVTKFCVMWEGLSLPHDTKFGNCRGEIVDRRMVFIWSLIHGSGWSRLIKAEPGDMWMNRIDRCMSKN